MPIIGAIVQAGEGELSLHGRAAARTPLLLHCLLLQADAARLVTACHLAAAAARIASLRTLVAAFPKLLAAPLTSACHMLSGAPSPPISPSPLHLTSKNSAALSTPRCCDRGHARRAEACTQVSWGEGDANTVQSTASHWTVQHEEEL